MKQTNKAVSFILSLACATALHAEPKKLELNTGEHVSIIGNTFADRMLHSSYLETLIHEAYPKANLVFRDLGFSGDEVTLDHRARSEAFGSPDEWLTKNKTDVVLAFFGFNESFGGPDGLEKFKADLTKFITDTRNKKYNGKSAPRIVLFSPIAQEKLADPNFPDPAANNVNIKLYAAAMAEVAKANDVQFIDLFATSELAYKDAKTSLTHNGLHLTEAGYKTLAPAMFEALFGQSAPQIDEKLRTAVVDKNEMFFSRYRTVDGYNVYGGRSRLEFPSSKPGEKISNNQVMQEEMAVRDVMTANRDQRVFAVAAGGDLTVDDSNLPVVEKVPTNKTDAKPFLDGEEAIKHMTVPKGVKVTLWADEKQFPELIKPVQMAWDTKGRLWVAAWRTYPEREPWDKQGDSILIFEDTKGTGHADKVTHFIDGLNCPTGFCFYKDGILLMQAPDLLYVKSTNGDDHANFKERVLDGMDSADSHHTTNSMVLDPGGATYLSDGVFHRTQVETADGPVRNTDGCIYRFEPRSGRFDRYVSYNFANPHGKVFDYWGTDFITDATGNANYFAPAFSGHIDGPSTKHPGMQEFWKRPSRPCAGTGMLSSRVWPEEFNGNFLNCNVIGFQGIFRVKNTPDGSGIKGESQESLVSSDDPNFRPAQVNTGPDGAVYFSDWSNAIIGHMQHHMRDPNRDHVHGRIYKMTYEGKLMTPAKIDGQPVEALLDLLKEPENDTRTRVKIELGKHDSAEVIAAVDKWAAALDKSDKSYEHNRLEALWVHQWHNVVSLDLLKAVLTSPEPNARAAATHVLCYWRDRVPEAIALLKTQANDESPRVRLEAIRALSFFGAPAAKDAMIAANDILVHSMDYYLDYTFKETTKQLQTLLKETVLPTDPKTLAIVLARMSNAELLKTPHTPESLMARIERPSIDLNERLVAVKELAKLHWGKPEFEFVSILKILDTQGEKGSLAAMDLSKMFGALQTAELTKRRQDIGELAATAATPGVRQTAAALTIIIDANPASTWAAAQTDTAKAAITQCLSMVTDASLREQFQPLLLAAINDPKSSPAVRAASFEALPLMGAANAKGNFALLAAALQKDDTRHTAARAIMAIPRDAWDVSLAAPAAQSIVAWAKSVPANQRVEQGYVETTQTGMELAGLLGSDGAAIRKEIRGLGVSVFVIKTVREQMRYDTTRLVVEAGKPFNVIMENTDFMPHNLVFTMPGTRTDVARSVATMKPDKLDAKGRAYFPDPKKDKRVIDGTRMVEPGQKETISLTAPKKEGEYEYVCTFPEHSQMMYGVLVVTKDVDAYLAAHPAAPVQPKMEHAH